MELPRITMQEALELASSYLDEKQIDRSNRTLLNIRWMSDGMECLWHLTWYTPDEFERCYNQNVRGGGMLSVSVNDDLEISHTYAI